MCRRSWSRIRAGPHRRPSGRSYEIPMPGFKGHGRVGPRKRARTAPWPGGVQVAQQPGWSAGPGARCAALARRLRRPFQSGGTNDDPACPELGPGSGFKTTSAQRSPHSSPWRIPVSSAIRHSPSSGSPVHASGRPWAWVRVHTVGGSRSILGNWTPASGWPVSRPRRAAVFTAADNVACTRASVAGVIPAASSRWCIRSTSVRGELRRAAAGRVRGSGTRTIEKHPAFHALATDWSWWGVRHF